MHHHMAACTRVLTGAAASWRAAAAARRAGVARSAPGSQPWLTGKLEVSMAALACLHKLQAPHAQHCRLALGLQSARTSRAPKRAGRAAHRCCRLHALHPRLAQLHGCSGMLMAQLQAHHAHRLTSTWHLAVQLAGAPAVVDRSRRVARSSGALYWLATHPLGCSAQWQHPHA